MTTGSQIHRSSEDKYVEDVYVTTKDLNYDVDIMSRKDIMTLGMRPINKFRAENRLILINENQLVSTLATLCSMMMIATGLNDLITSYTYIHASETLSWGCMDISDANDFVNKFKPKSDFIKSISWIWLSCGIWGGILPLCTGFMMNCSTNLSAKSPVNEGTYFGTIFYNANFPPKNPPGVKLFRLLSIVDLIVVFLLSVINTAVSSHCIGPRYPITKYVFPLVVCFLCVILFFLIFISPWIKRRQLSKDENLHVGHTHILVRKFPVVGTDRKYVEPRLVNYGPPVNLPWKPAQPRPPSWTHLDDEWKNY